MADKKTKRKKKYYNEYKIKRIYADFERELKLAYDRWYKGAENE